MSYISIILLAIALSIDACVVSFSYGLILNENRIKNSLYLALTTAFCQGLMPIIGYFLTGFVKGFIEPYSKFIVFFIFVYLGIKFIKEAFESERKKQLCLDIKCLIFVGIATSIDAFSAGISLSLFGNKIFKPALLIAFVTFVNSIIGFYAGGKLKFLPVKSLEILAGMLLIFLGIKALI